MSRFFVPITIDELKAKVNACLEKGPDVSYRSLTPTVEKDLNKIQFDTENIDISAYGIWRVKKDILTGYHSWPNGLTFLGVNAGGDWEVPIFFIIYWDGKQLRGYIPTEGNTFNRDTKTALGNDEEADEAYLQKMFPDAKKDEDLQAKVFCDPLRLAADILERILSHK